MLVTGRCAREMKPGPGRAFSSAGCAEWHVGRSPEQIPRGMATQIGDSSVVDLDRLLCSRDLMRDLAAALL